MCSPMAARSPKATPPRCARTRPWWKPISAHREPSMLSIENLTSAYGRIEVLHGIYMEIRTGEIASLIGANGAGKTTLLRAISGVQPITSGDIRLEGRSIASLQSHARVALGISHVPEGRQLFAPLSVEDNLKLGAWSRPASEAASELAR